MNIFTKKEFVIFAVTLIAGTALLTFIYFNVYEEKGVRAFYWGGGDSGEYLALADNVLAGRGFSIHRESPYEVGATRTPGYPLIVAFTRFFGRAQDFVLIFLQIGVLGFTAILSYRLMKKFISERTAFFSTFFIIFHPQTLLVTLTIMSDIFFFFFFLASLYAFVLFLETKKKKYFYTTSFLLGISVVMRPGGLFLFPIYLLFLIPEVVGVIHKKNILQSVIMIFLAVLFLLLPVVPWSLRNYIEFGTFRLSSADTYNLYYVVLPTVIGIRDEIPREDALQMLHERLSILPGFTRGRAHDTFEYAVEMEKEAKKIIISSPLIFAYATLREIPVFLLQAEWATPLIKWRMLTIPDNYVSFKQSVLKDGFFGFRTVVVQKLHCGTQCVLPLLMLFFGTLFWALLFLFTLIGFLGLMRGGEMNRFLWLFAVFVVYFVVLHSALINTPNIPERYKLPMLPLLFIFAWYGWEKTKTLSKRFIEKYVAGQRVISA